MSSKQIDGFKPGVYRHYRHTDDSPRYYQVLGVARNTETEELYALYVPLYVIPGHTGPRYQVRPLAMFHEDVTWQDKTTKRFTYMGQEMKPEFWEEGNIT